MVYSFETIIDIPKGYAGPHQLTIYDGAFFAKIVNGLKSL